MTFKLALTSSRMEFKHELQKKTMKINPFGLPEKVADVSKYNLRCNRNISEKMTKKDFIYDIRRPVQGTRKYEDHKQRLPIIIPTRVRKQKSSDTNSTKYSLVLNNSEIVIDSDTSILPVSRALNFECNFCHEPIATMSSLSTHVKFHQLQHCKKCYWILKEGETMENHLKKEHQINL